MKAFTTANAVLRFPLELCMLAAFAYWGSRATNSTVANVATGLAIVFGVTVALNATLVHLLGEI